MTIQRERQNNEPVTGQRMQMRTNAPTYEDRRTQWDRRQSYGDGGQPNWQQSKLQQSNTSQITQALGWFSIGLGLAQLAVPSRFTRWLGINDDGNNQTVVRAVGLREIVSGVGLLTQSKPAGWLKARVGGDVMDLALLGGALRSNNAEPSQVATAMAAVAGITVLDMLAAQQFTEQPYAQQADRRFDQRYNQPMGQPSSGSVVSKLAASTGLTSNIHVKKSLMVNRSPEELYQFWRNFENLPRFMTHLESVQVQGDRRSHWKAKAPAGTTVEWDAEISDDRPNEQIAWRSLENADVRNTGSVRFERAPADRGTKVTVEIYYDAPGGAIGSALAKLFGEEPSQQVQDDLRVFKQVMETGDMVRSDATLWGPSAKQRPAQPPTQAELMRQ
ncbi:MAG: SRPBCC family protein [Caldilineaceae bacterium]